MLSPSAASARGAEDVQVFNLPWLICLRPAYVGKTDGDLLTSLIRDPLHPTLPIGLYRRFESDVVMRGSYGFVWTNPSKDTILRAEDLVYVLGSMGFGRWALQDGILPNAQSTGELTREESGPWATR